MSAQKRLSRDLAELLKIRGASVVERDDPNTVNLFYRPPQGDTKGGVYEFRVTIPSKYPFVPPTWKWVSLPNHKPHPCLGPDGVVSVEALSQWTPANSLSNVLISLFPSCMLAEQCSSVTSHLWNLKHNRDKPALTITSPEVLDCLATHLIQRDPATAHALHCTCRAAAAAVQDAMTSLAVTGRHADLAHTAHAFPGLSDLTYTQCAVLVEPLLDVDGSMHLFNSLRTLSIIRCDVQLFGERGLFAALRRLPALHEFSFEPATAMLWAVYDNEGCLSAAKCPAGEESKLEIPDEVPKPVPFEWSSIWAGVASVTQLTSLSVTIPLCDKLLPSQRDTNRHSWPAAAAIANYAFSQRCLASMPNLKHLSVDIQHMQASRSPSHAEEAGNGAENNSASQIAAWSLPCCKLSSFSISGIAIGTEQFNYEAQTQAFWGGLDSVHIGHTAVTDDLQSSALKRIVSLARNVQNLDIASVEELLSKLAVATSGSVLYKSLKNLRSLHTSLTSELEGSLQLTHIKFCHNAPYMNLRTIAANLPQLRCLEGLPFQTPNDPKNYWPLKQCSHLEKLVMNHGPSGSAEDIAGILGPGVEVVVPDWSGHNPRSQAIFRRGFLPAHRPILSSLVPSTGQAAANTSMMSDSDFECIAAQGYALGYENSSAADSGPLDAVPAGAGLKKALRTKLQPLAARGDSRPESPPHQNLNPNIIAEPAPFGVPGHVAAPRSAAPVVMGTPSVPRTYPDTAQEGGLNQTSAAAAATATNRLFERSVRRHASRSNMQLSSRQHGLSSFPRPDVLLDSQQSITAGPVSVFGIDANTAWVADQERRENAPSSAGPVGHYQSSWENLCNFPGMGSAEDDEEMWDVAEMEGLQSAQPLHQTAQEGSQFCNPTLSLGGLFSTDAHASAASTPTSDVSGMNGFLQAEADPFRDGTWHAGSFARAANQEPIMRHASIQEQGFSVLRPRSTQMQVPSSFFPASASLQQPHESDSTSALCQRRTPSPAPCATRAEVSTEAALQSSRERSHSPVSRRFGADWEQSVRFGKSSPYRGPASRAAPGNTTADRFNQSWQGVSPTSRTSSSLFSDDHASPVQPRSSSEEPAQSPSSTSAALRSYRARSTRVLGDGATSSDLRAERVRLESLEIHPLRQQSAEVLRSLQRHLSRAGGGRRGTQDARMNSKKPTRLHIYGSEATPQGLSSTTGVTTFPSNLDIQPLAVPVPSLHEAPMLCEDHVPSEGVKVIKIVEMPLCSCGHRPKLIAQVPSLVDLTKEDVTGTSTDSLLVVSNELHKNVVTRQSGAIRAHRAKSGPGALDCIPLGDCSMASQECVPENCIIEQVHREPQDVNMPCTSAMAEMGGVLLRPVARQSCKALWISCWVPTEPALEAPARNDVTALARMYNVPAPPTPQQSQSNASSKLGGNTRSAASPSCKLCCNRMGLVLSLPSDGTVVTQPRSCAMIVEVFKCLLHPHEMQCSWSCHEEQAPRPQEENAGNAE